MNLLTQGIEQKLVEKTEMSQKITIDGLTKIYPVYKVRLDCLYFNDRNDRIATWISKYKTENNITDFDKNDLEAYNDIIQKFIEDSNQDAIKRTQTNIELIGQKHPGVVLADGRIIDGNRRFTCLRNLSKKYTQNNNYFETVILEHNIESNEKQIKMLELQLQMGEESRVDYNPIDRLVGIYHDIVENRLLTIKEYADSINKTPTDVEKDVEVAKLLVEYLEFINAPNQFYIAREQDLNGPLVEIPSILKNIKSEEEKDRLKATLFTNLLMQPAGDMTRYIRDVKSIAKDSDTVDEYLNRSQNVVDNFVESLPEIGKVTPDVISAYRSNDAAKDELRRAKEVAVNKANARKTKDLPIQNLNKAIDNIKSIDNGIFSVLSEDKKTIIAEKIDELIELSKQLEEKLHVS